MAVAGFSERDTEIDRQTDRGRKGGGWGKRKCNASQDLFSELEQYWFCHILLARASHKFSLESETLRNIFHSGGKELPVPLQREVWIWGEVESGGHFTNHH